MIEVALGLSPSTQHPQGGRDMFHPHTRDWVPFPFWKEFSGISSAADAGSINGVPDDTAEDIGFCGLGSDGQPDG
jgi:hypothetical protein